jgi:predicted dehydrogenase
MNRRAFITTAGVGVVAGFAGDALVSAAEPTSSAKRIHIGFLGATHSHALEKLRVVLASPDFELVGVCEEDAAARENVRKLGVALLAREELFQRSAVIAVESAVGRHAPDALAALRAGKHVHVEKPPAVTLDAFREMQSVARAKKLLLQVGYMWRFNPGFVAALEAAQQGWLGEIYLVRATMNTLLAANRRPEWAEFKGGAMFEQGCHLIDPLVRLLGAPTAVRPMLRTHGGSDALADNCVVVFEFPKALGIVTNATLQPNAFAHRFFEILGTNGTALLKPLEPPALQIDLAKAAGPYKAGTQTVSLPAYRRYVDEFAALARALREGAALAVAPEQELMVQETLLRASEML